MRRLHFFFIILFLAQVAVFPLEGYERPARPCTESGSFTIRFNGDWLKAYYKFFDARSDDEKKENKSAGKLSGAAIIFFHGHAQRPDNADEFITRLTRDSKSGVLLIPVCDTPYGSDPAWRGDAGKDIILMEVSRRVFGKHGITIQNYSIPPVAPKLVIEDADAIPIHNEIATSILAAGYSHGAILARRFASKYPASVESLVHICPAGYIQWGENSCLAGPRIFARFSWESMRISTGYFSGEGMEVTSAGWGIARGVGGDCLRSAGSCAFGGFNPLKAGRPLRDIKDCATYLDDTNFPVGHLKSITVLFGENDSLFPYRAVGIANPKSVVPEEASRFFEKFYPSAMKNGSILSLKVLPGNHIGLQIYPDDYVATALSCAGEDRNSTIIPAKKEKRDDEQSKKTAFVGTQSE